MKFLGNISHISNSGKLIARSSETPPSGAFIFNKDKKKIGKVSDVFGPTKNPYISIKLFRSFTLKDFEDSHGDELYVSINNRKNRRGRGKRKKK
ncbi:MAG: Gar1/Naf1 family protein [Methanobrevibacter sp.]|nr:Gar1/Naf1 family protein [Methanobrevibacter sp.]